MSPAELRVVLLILGFLVTDSALSDPCVNHTVLDQPWRSTDCAKTECTGGQRMDDGNLEVGWYRFHSSGGWKIPETVVPQEHCSGKKPGWLNGPHPNVGEGEVTRTVCFSKGNKLCDKQQQIRVKNCSGYFVYWLKPTPLGDAVMWEFLETDSLPDDCTCGRCSRFQLMKDPIKELELEMDELRSIQQAEQLIDTTFEQVLDPECRIRGADG
ncbi:pancreatic secretory granule membrane major glycoprotein GP2-like [Hemitrygon akajei]|uniref:pancreatic secretory granule membrane major glycoprotein GP2-like n=1 Tax=Hemitrygon akajei TaxID=2704970 RepID=UPI003BF99365